MPVIEVQPIPMKYEGELGVPTGPKCTLDQHVEKIADKIETVWGSESPICIDLLRLEEYGTLADGTHPLTHVLNDAMERGLQVIPTTQLQITGPYQAAVIAHVHANSMGACVRIGRRFCHAPTSLIRHLGELVMTLGVTASQIDLILDFGPIEAEEADEIGLQIRDVIAELPNIDEWRTVGFAGTSMPQRCMEGLGRFETKRICRTEWKIWNSLVADGLPGPLTFCDYGITHPEPYELDFREITLVGKVRYSTPTEWIIAKGKRLKEKEDYEQYHRLAEIITTQPECCDPSFSWGDSFVADCATLIAETGSPEKWAAVTTNHHLTRVSHDVASVV